MIEAKNLTAGYGGEKIISDINLKINKGKITTVLGPNGSGKTTLLKCFARQIMPMEGEILTRNKSIFNFEQKDFAKKISFLPQCREIPMITVERLVAHGRYPYLGFSRKLTDEDREIVQASMEKMGIAQIAKKNISEVSGGERQKAYLAMALAQGAELLIFDEPTTYLDIKHQIEIQELIINLKQEGKTILTVLHDINTALKMSDKLILMKEGRVEFEGTPKEVIETKMLEKVFEVEFKLIVNLI